MKTEPKLYHFRCPICDREVTTKFKIQRTCGQAKCQGRHSRKPTIGKGGGQQGDTAYFKRKRLKVKEEYNLHDLMEMDAGKLAIRVNQIIEGEKALVM